MDQYTKIPIGSKAHVNKFPETKISIAGVNVPSSKCVTYLGVNIDEHLSMVPHVNKVISSTYWQLRRISSIRHCLTEKSATTLVLTMVMSNIDYCNSLLVGETQGHLRRLQQVQNTAARIVKRPPSRAHITPILQELHWLPVHQRIVHKTLSHVFRCINGSAPLYLMKLLRTYKPVRHLRSSAKLLLQVPRCNKRKSGERAFAYAGPKLWNDLPDELRMAPSVQTFKSQLKTLLFRQMSHEAP